MRYIILPRRQHPTAMLRFTFRFLLLLSLPLIRGLHYIRTPSGLAPWLRGVWLDLTVILILIVFPYIHWRRHTYCLTDTAFELHHGLFLRRTITIPRRHVTTLTVERPLYLRIFRAARIIIDTEAGDRYRADLTLTVSEKHAREIFCERQHRNHRARYHYRPNGYRVVILSLLVSDTLSGIVLLVSAFHQTGRLLGEHYQEQVLGNIEAVADYMHILPRTTAFIALALLLGWGVAAIRSLLRHLPFESTRYHNLLSVRTGALVRRDYLCTVSAVNYVDDRQTLFCKLFRLHIIFIHCIGYGKKRHSLSLLVPASNAEHSSQAVHGLLPEFQLSEATVRPSGRSLMRYIFIPLLSIILLFPLSVVCSTLFPAWTELIRHLTVIAFIPCVWFLLVRIVDRYTAGIAWQHGFVTLRYSRQFTLHTVIIPKKKIIACRVRQSPFQRRKNVGDLLIYTHSEDTRRHRIKNIRMTDLQRFLKETAN